MSLVNMHRHFSTLVLMSCVLSTEKRPTGLSTPVSESRFMATNRGISEIENFGNWGPDNPIMEILKQLVQEDQTLNAKVEDMRKENQALNAKIEEMRKENQALNAEVGTVRMQMIEMMGILQALKNGTTTEAAAVVNSGETATILPTSGPAETVIAIPHPGSGVNHPARALGGTEPYEVFHFNDVVSCPQGHLFENSQLKNQLDLLEKRLKAVESLKSGAKEARDLCLVPDLVIPPKMKVPSFDQYCGASCPNRHITMYARRMTAYTHDDKLLIHYFQYSLTGASLDWYLQLQPSDIHSWKDLSEAFVKQYEYNKDMAPDRIRLQLMSKKDDESFKEYVQRWRNTAAQVKPPLTEKEMVSMFMETLPAVFYERLVGSASASFLDMVTIGEGLEVGMKRGRISCNPTSADNASDLPTKKNGGINAIMGQVKSRQYDPIPMTYTDLCSYLINHDLISPRGMKPIRPPFPRRYNAKATCEFHSGAIGHSAENCHPLKQLVQDLIDTKQLAFDENGEISTVKMNPPSLGTSEWK